MLIISHQQRKEEDTSHPILRPKNKAYHRSVTQHAGPHREKSCSRCDLREDNELRVNSEYNAQTALR